jgi:NAD(P)H-flavin reductase
LKNSLKPVKVIIKDIKPEAEGVKTYTLSAGDSFSPQPGQFNMVGYPGVGEAPISLSSIIHEGCLEHTIKSVGKLTNFISRLNKGDELFLRGPYGRGWPIKEAKGKDVLLIAGGVGLAPIRPVIQTILNKRKSFGKVSLIYGARNEGDVLFMNEFETWQREVSLYLTVDEVLAHGKWKHNVGLVTELIEMVRINPEKTIAFVCGPEIMMRFICRGLLITGISHASIYVSLERRMKCGIAQCGHCQHYGLFVCKDGPVFSYREVRGLPDGLL